MGRGGAALLSRRGPVCGGLADAIGIDDAVEARCPARDEPTQLDGISTRFIRGRERARCLGRPSGGIICGDEVIPLPIFLEVHIRELAGRGNIAFGRRWRSRRANLGANRSSGERKRPRPKTSDVGATIEVAEGSVDYLSP